jgi:hypothetical protein
VNPPQVKFDFLRNEVRLGLTFLDLAQVADGDEDKARNFENARKAHDALLRFRDGVEMTDAQSAEIQTGIDQIGEGLLGEALHP